nr:unnamed protein product [Digitaria exilis]
MVCASLRAAAAAFSSSGSFATTLAPSNQAHPHPAPPPNPHLSLLSLFVPAPGGGPASGGFRARELSRQVEEEACGVEEVAPCGICGLLSSYLPLLRARRGGDPAACLELKLGVEEIGPPASASSSVRRRSA